MSMVNQQKCLICEGNNLKNYLNVIDSSVSKETFLLSQCANCDFIFTNPHPNQQEIGRYYASEEYISHSDSKKGIVNSIYHEIRKIALKNKIKLINKLNNQNSGKLLDIGCGTGYFLEAATKNGWVIEGFEPDNNAREIANQKLINKVVLNLNDIKSTKFDVITLWHVLEHVHDINTTIEKSKELLSDNGTIIIAVPNIESWDSKHYLDKWAALDVPRHLYHFSKKTLTQYMKNHDLVVEAILPMKFDSFYVSIMSEKYANKKLGLVELLKGLVIGAISNLKANSNNYSSLIYVIKKRNENL